MTGPRARRIVIKIGSALLAGDDGAVRTGWLEGLAAAVAMLRADTRKPTHCLIVSSGAIALGRTQLALAAGPRNRALRLEESQAAAAVGQIALAHAWQAAFGSHGSDIAQILLTLDDTEHRRRFLNARGTLTTLLKLGVLPVINENDTVATDEIRFGDNDRLAARVAQMVGADICLLLTSVDGLYTSDPSRDAEARHIGEVTEITPRITAMASADGTAHGSGGMVTKLAAARIAMESGCALVIADGRGAAPLAALDGSVRATWFRPRQRPAAARKQWIAAGLRPMGTVTIDAGAAAALTRKGSLLPAGVRAVSGNFARGDLVRILTPEGDELAVGLTAYGAKDARLIMGRRSGMIGQLLGYRGREEMIHRDDLVLRRKQEA